MPALDQRELTDLNTRYWAAMYHSELSAVNDFRVSLGLDRLGYSDLSLKENGALNIKGGLRGFKACSSSV